MSALDQVLTSPAARALTLALTRITMAGLLFWWGLVKGLNTGVGPAVSEGFYGGAFGGVLLIAFGWVQVLAALSLALGLARGVLLPFQLIVNLSTLAVTAAWVIDPFWLWMPGESPRAAGYLFYPSAIVAAVSLLLITFRHEDRYALDHVVFGKRSAAA